MKSPKVMQRLAVMKKMNLYPFFRPIAQSEGTKVQVGGHEQIMIGSNNYLGLTHHPYVVEKAIKAIETYGTGCTGSRFLNGNLIAHEELEDKLAKFLGHEKALLFSTGMQSNLGAISSIAGRNDLILSDSENHASIIDACRLSHATTVKYRHNDMLHLEELLRDHSQNYQEVIIITDGVFSMTGELAPMDKIQELASKYKASVYCDDAHGIGVLGPKGQGTLAHFQVTNKVRYNMGTFSKSFASIGGYVSGNADDMEYLKHSARSFIFSASMPPSAVATVSACIDVLQDDTTILSQLWDNVNFLKKGFEELELKIYPSQTPILSVHIGEELQSLKAVKFLEAEGIFATAVLPPAVAPGQALIRTSTMATHSKEELTKVLEVFAKAKKNNLVPCKSTLLSA